MDRFPLDHELIGFFEVEPTLLDADVPAVYNRVTYHTVRGSEEVVCHIERAAGQVDIQWLREGNAIAAFALRGVVGLEVIQNASGEHLVASFRDSSVSDFALWLRPHVRVEWGTNE